MRWIAGIAIALIGSPCWAQDDGKFTDLVGVWAHTAAACADFTSGKVDRLPDRASQTPYELVGICANGIDLLYQPVGCRTDATKGASGNKVDVRSNCSVKDYEPQAGTFGIDVAGPDAIAFHEDDFTGDFSIAGDYVRCERHYTCSERVNELEAPPAGGR
jgi:hypothetical protein